MEFSYRISEEDYLIACDIKVTPRRSRRISWLTYAFQLLLFLTVFCAVVYGLLIGGRMQAGEWPPIGATLLESIIPAFFITVMNLVAYRAIHGVLARRRRSDSRLEHYRTDPSFENLMTLTVTPEMVRLRSGKLSLLESGWGLYREWAESGHMLLLVTHAGTRWIVNAGGLSKAEGEELRGILRASVPSQAKK